MTKHFEHNKYEPVLITFKCIMRDLLSDGCTVSFEQQNVVHRDLKLGNLVLHRATREIIITNFCLGQHLPSEKDRLRDQRGSPAYISPDVLSGKPYLGNTPTPAVGDTLIVITLFIELTFCYLVLSFYACPETFQGNHQTCGP